MISNPPEGHRFQPERVGFTFAEYRLPQCECGAEFPWSTRESDHERHVFAVIWEQGYRSGISDEFLSQDWTNGQSRPNRHNPYEVAK